MEAKQVFLTYDKQNLQYERYKYCPYCGIKLLPTDDHNRLHCLHCGFIAYQNPFPGVVVLITEGKSILLGKRCSRSFQAGKWSLPGGYIEFDEDFLTAAIRETKEETNLDVRIRSILSVVTNFLAPNLHTLVIVMLADVCGGNMKAGDDFDELAWFSVSESLPEMAFLADQHIIERYFKANLIGAPVDPEYSSPSI